MKSRRIFYLLIIPVQVKIAAYRGRCDGVRYRERNGLLTGLLLTCGYNVAGFIPPLPTLARNTS